MNEYITDKNGNHIYAITLYPREVPITLRCYSTSGSTDIRLCIVRADLREEAPASEDTDISVINGQAMIDAGEIEGRLTGTETWYNVCKWANALQLGAITAGNYVEFDLKTTVDAGIISFGIAVRALI